jgi:hypothetical protein
MKNHIKERIEYLTWYIEARQWTFANNQKTDEYFANQMELFRLKKLMKEWEQ